MSSSSEVSVVKYKLKADPSYTDCPLDPGAASISVARLKAVITEQKLKGNAAFGLKLTNVSTGEEYTNDIAQVAAGTNILVKRVPISQISSGGSSCAAAVGCSCSVSTLGSGGVGAGSCSVAGGAVASASGGAGGGGGVASGAGGAGVGVGGVGGVGGAGGIGVGLGGGAVSLSTCSLSSFGAPMGGGGTSCGATGAGASMCGF